MAIQLVKWQRDVLNSPSVCKLLELVAGELGTPISP